MGTQGGEYFLQGKIKLVILFMKNLGFLPSF